VQKGDMVVAVYGCAGCAGGGIWGGEWRSVAAEAGGRGVSCGGSRRCFSSAVLTIQAESPRVGRGIQGLRCESVMVS